MKLFAGVGVVIWLACGAAFAQDAPPVEMYYIELGKEPTAETALKTWNSIHGTHKDLLKNLRYFPATVIQLDNTKLTRVLAGPMTDKKKAQKLCTKLFKKEVSCFVIEGLVNPTSIETVGVAPETAGAHVLPWQVQARPARPAASLPWLGAPAAKAEVNVAEAIAVPLSSDKRAMPRAAGWLNISSFVNEDAALTLWRRVRANAADATAGLRVRMVRPLESQGKEMLLNVGPFANAQNAMDFCQKAILPADNALRCAFAESEATGGALQPVSAQERSAQYTSRRKPLAGNQSSELVYWLKIVAAKTEFAAVQRWEKIRAEHADLLEGIKSDIVPGVNNVGYVVKIGPLPSEDTAGALCQQLKSRKIACRIFAEK